MRPRAIIELTHLSDGELPIELLEAAYRASETTGVVLVLPASMIRLVDKLLDPVVQTVGPTSSGIRYLDPSDEPAVRAVLASATCVVAVTAPFRMRCQALGVPVLGVEAGIARLRDGAHSRVPGTISPSSSQQIAVAG